MRNEIWRQSLKFLIFDTERLIVWKRIFSHIVLHSDYIVINVQNLVLWVYLETCIAIHFVKFYFNNFSCTIQHLTPICLLQMPKTTLAYFYIKALNWVSFYSEKKASFAYLSCQREEVFVNWEKRKIESYIE